MGAYTQHGNNNPRTNQSSFFMCLKTWISFPTQGILNNNFNDTDLNILHISKIDHPLQVIFIYYKSRIVTAILGL